MALVRISVAVADGRLQQIVIPDRDAQLADPAFSPEGCISADVARGFYDDIAGAGALPCEAVILQAVQPLIAEIDFEMGLRVQERIGTLAVSHADDGNGE